MLIATLLVFNQISRTPDIISDLWHSWLIFPHADCAGLLFWVNQKKKKTRERSAVRKIHDHFIRCLLQFLSPTFQISWNFRSNASISRLHSSPIHLLTQSSIHHIRHSVSSHWTQHLHSICGARAYGFTCSTSLLRCVRLSPADAEQAAAHGPQL